MGRSISCGLGVSRPLGYPPSPIWGTTLTSIRYTVELSGVGISDRPSYYPPSDPNMPRRPIFATQTAIFRLTSEPTRSPRSVRISELPFMPGSQESLHTHKLAGRFVHPATVQTGTGTGKMDGIADVRTRVKRCMEAWEIGQVSLTELWGVSEVAGACAGRKRYLVGCLGGFGDCEAIPPGGEEVAREYAHDMTQRYDAEFKVIAQDGVLSVVWTTWVPRRNEVKDEDDWGVMDEHASEKETEGTGGW